jgi:hypothetical protein
MPHEMSPKRETSFVRGLLEEMTSCSLTATGSGTGRFVSHPILASLSLIPQGAAVSADLGFTVIAIKSERVVMRAEQRAVQEGSSPSGASNEERYIQKRG